LYVSRSLLYVSRSLLGFPPPVSAPRDTKHILQRTPSTKNTFYSFYSVREPRDTQNTFYREHLLRVSSSSLSTHGARHCLGFRVQGLGIRV
jgi:hypothetical protein